MRAQGGGRRILISVGQSLFVRFSALALGAIALFALGYVHFGLRPLVHTIAEGEFGLAGNRVEETLRQTFTPVEDLVAVAAQWGASPGFSLDDPHPFNALFIPLLERLPQVTSVVAGTSAGQGWLLLQHPDGYWHNRFTDIPAWGDEHLFIDWRDGDEARRERMPFDYDPRSRPWFTGAMDADAESAHWTPPYLFFTTGMPGISVSSRRLLDDGRDLVVGFDIKLIDISAATSRLTVGRRGCALVMTGGGRLIGLPAASPASDAPPIDARLLLQSVEDLPLPAVRKGVGAWRAAGAPTQRIVRYAGEEGAWLASFHPFALGSETLWVALFAPEGDFIPPWRPLLQGLGFIVLAVLGLSVFSARRQAIRFGAPLQELAAGSERIAQLDFGEGEPLQTNYKEFHQLARAHDSMREMLRSYRDALEAQTADLRSALGERQAILDNALVGIVLVKDRAIVQHNRRASELLGYGGEAIAGRPMEEFYPDRDAFVAGGEKIYQALRSEESTVQEMWLKRRDGSLMWTRLNGRALDPANPMEGAVWVLADLSDQKAAEDRLHYLGYHDALTGLPNRHLFSDRVEHGISRAQREGERLAVLLIDLDHFKTINDTQGHPFGDRMLCVIAEKLRAALRASDTLARLGGDEFAVLIESVTGTSKILKVTAKLMETFSAPLDVDGRAVYMSASIGISLYPADGKDGRTLLQNADAAMYQAKAQGRNTFHFYSQEMTQKALSRMEIEDVLRRALDVGGVEFHFQPQVSLLDGRVTGAEALVRLRHPEKGLIPPLDFIPLAEESGLILQLGNRALEESCRMWAELARQGVRLPRIAVNVSAKQLQRGDFVEVVKAILAAHAVPPAALELEITESAFLESESALDLLRELGEYGVCLSLDDFGTGYSSLSYLKRLPFGKLKIDREFIRGIGRDPDGEALVRTIINLAANLGLEVIAEGVETQAQCEFLLREGCATAQGYLFAKALPAELFCEWLRSRPDGNVQEEGNFG